MLCLPCRRALLQRISSSARFASRTPPLQTSRNAATVSGTSNAASTQPPESTPLSDTTPAALSSPASGATQPLSTPHILTTKTTSTSGAKQTKLRGSLTGGTVLHGVSFLKSRATVHAKEDDEYPPWLWTLLDSKNAGGETKADISALTNKQRAKHDRKQERLRAALPKQIPVHEQSNDLTGPMDDATVSLERRQEITKTSRVARRKGIREDNFLRSM